MTSDAMTFIMKGIGCKVHACIDDYIVVAHKYVLYFYLSGCLPIRHGGIWINRMYSCPAVIIPCTKLHINHLEMFNIVLALRLWGQYWTNTSVWIRCDNLAVVQVVQNLKTKDNILAACVHNIYVYMCFVEHRS